MKYKCLLRNSSLLSFLMIMLLSCSKVDNFYRYERNNSDKQEQIVSPNNQWHSLELNNHVVVHVGLEMWEISGIRTAENSDTISANFKEFDGVALESYLKVLEKRRGIAFRKKGAGIPDIQQVHLYLNRYERLNDSQLAFGLNDVYQVDVSKDDKASNLAAQAGLGIGLSVAGGAAFVLIACNCPHVYIDNGEGLEFNNTLFTGAKATQLERFDYKEIPDYFPNSDQFTLKIVNEEKEDQYTNLVELVSVMHDKNLEVMADKHGELHTIGALTAAKSAIDNNGFPILNFLNERDDYPYSFNPTDFKDLAEVEVKFDAQNKTRDAKLVVRARNTMWSGYVYNEFNKLFGKNHGKWVEMNKDKSKEEREKWMREQGIKMLVDIKQAGEWVTIDEVEVFGEASMNQVVIPIQRNLFGDELEVRLRSGFMFWELDFVGVDFSENETVEIQVHKPAKAAGNNGTDFTQQLSFDDNNYMQHALAEELNSTEVRYENLPVEASRQRTLILKSKGYYVPKSEYTGKTDRKRLQSFANPGELSRFSLELYKDVMQEMVEK